MEASVLQRLLDSGRRPILAELDPPRQEAPAAFLAAARELYACGADLITVADCPIGRASIDASMVAAKLKRESGVEVLPHMACRDRNLNAIKALLMGLDMEGVRQVLLITGDPVSHEDEQQVKGVFQLNAKTLAKAVSGLSRQGKLADFYLCGALNINARNFDAEISKAREKEQNGIRAFLTQPVCSRRAADNLRLAREQLKGRLLGGLFPVVSYNNARFLQREVAGVAIDESIVASYAGLDRAQGEARGLQLCLDAARDIAPWVDGYYIMTPFRRVALVKALMAHLRRLP